MSHLVGFVADESNDHAVKVEEEHQQVEAKLDERFLSGVSTLESLRPALHAPDLSGTYLLMDIQLPEDLCRVEQVVLLEDSSICQQTRPSTSVEKTYFLPFHAKRGRFRMSAIQYPLMRNRKVRKA